MSNWEQPHKAKIPMLELPADEQHRLFREAAAKLAGSHMHRLIDECKTLGAEHQAQALLLHLMSAEAATYSILNFRRAKNSVTKESVIMVLDDYITQLLRYRESYNEHGMVKLP